MTHFYNDSDMDCFWCDSCTSEIIGNMYDIDGNELENNKKARGLDEHFCQECNDHHKDELA